MYDNLYSDNNVFIQGTICACLLAYAAFRRASELLSLRRCDIEFFPSHAHYIMYPSNTIKGLIDRIRPGIMLHQTR
jgi:hypothetical protein